MLGAADCGENHGAWLCNRVTTFTENETAACVPNHIFTMTKGTGATPAAS